MTALASHRDATRCALMCAAGIAALYLGTLLICHNGLVADGYDGIGFVLAVDRFDLARFAPQPPGYPLFVIAGRLLHFLGLRAALALAVVNALFVAAGLGAFAAVLRVAGGRRLALLFLLLGPTAPIVYGLGMATLSDGAGFGCGLLGGVLALRAIEWKKSLRAHALAGFVLGVALGIRPPLLPLLAILVVLIYGPALLRKSVSARAVLILLVASAATVLLWLLPFAVAIGPRTLVTLTWQHAHGHFTDFGGSAWVETSRLGRLRDFARGLCESALGRGGVILLLPALVGLGGLLRDRAARKLLGAIGLFMLLDGIYTLLALPTSGHGRHLLPLTVALLSIVALGLARFFDQPIARFLLLVAGVGVVIDNGRAVFAFRGTLPPGAALGNYVAKTLPMDRLYGARASRYLDLSLGSGSARPAIYFGEVLASLERESNLPNEVLITSEVLVSPSSRGRLKALGSFCYADAVPRVLRFDYLPYGHGAAKRAEPCVELLAYRVRR